MPRKPVASDAELAKLATLGDVPGGESIPAYRFSADQAALPAPLAGTCVA